MSKPFKHDYTGQRFGRLMVVAYAGKYKGTSFSAWDCICDCGTKAIVNQRHLATGITRSCGCLHRESTAQRSTTHGYATRSKGKTSTYRIWWGVITRCTNPNSSAWPDYGGRGITVSDEWRKFENFLADMGERPGNLSIERLDNNGPYSKDNCVWATFQKQCRNKRSNMHLTYDGRTQIQSDWAKEFGITKATLSRRLQRGMSIGDALTIKPWGMRSAQESAKWSAKKAKFAATTA